MIWLLWRRHRVALVILTALILGLGAAFFVAGLVTRAVFPAELLGRCTEQDWPQWNCGLSPDDPAAVYLRTTHYAFTLVTFLPILTSVFLAIPAFAGEYQSGTARWGLTQGVSRDRWFLAQAAAVLLPTLAWCVILQLGIQFWLGPVREEVGLSPYGGMSVNPLGLPMATLFLAATGLFTGAWLRRTSPAIAVTVIGSYLILFANALLRPWYLPPVVAEANTVPGGAGSQVRIWPTDPAGTEISWIHAADLAAQHAPAGEQDLDPYYAEAGIRIWVSYHPEERIWLLNLIEAGILFALTALCLFGAWQLVRRRG
ncbi:MULTISPECIES: ABC transporter permease [Actinoalloteichus]|uniref:ABC-2 family transporter protein n=1 Tax=Actinoalloteichus fjordicus TaxID=1612552 RepID=A0AAC9LI25_9PSEU|nr:MULTISPECIES: ABC transporter permease [Actinoalloteichus]APU17162.1 ABC-2 family transporter protein [Actinoalloteichus fjordicus]APU23245.1 ABC-2 family transporter protein [Actinoalloteichus sp. GBA129-24]